MLETCVELENNKVYRHIMTNLKMQRTWNVMATSYAMDLEGHRVYLRDVEDLECCNGHQGDVTDLETKVMGEDRGHG